jgi:hypothetical protein
MRSHIRLLSLCLVIGLSAAGVAAAQELPSTGLGQSWPNAPDVSASPAFHVFLFERAGTRYVQVNDLNGNVRAAFAYAGNDIMGLPVGVDANRLVTSNQPLAQPASGTLVYRDASVTVTAVPSATGSMGFQAVIGDCKNPAECAAHGP